MTPVETIISLATERAVAATESWRMTAAHDDPRAVPAEPSPEDRASLEPALGRSPTETELRAFRKAFCESAEQLRHGGPSGTDLGPGSCRPSATTPRH